MKKVVFTKAKSFVGQEEPSEDYQTVNVDSKSIIQLATNRSIYFFGSVDKQSVLNAISQIHLCESMGKEDIFMYINSDGGFINDCFALIDVMDNSPCDINTIVLGTAASAACIIASNGTSGKRFAGKNSEIMYHESYGNWFEVKSSEINYYAQELIKTQERCDAILKRNTGKTTSEIKKCFLEKRLDKFMTAKEAKEFGIIDEILSTRRRK